MTRRLVELNILKSTPEIFWLAVVNVLLILGLSVAMPSLFLSGGNLSSMAVQFPGYGLLALAMMIPMLTGGIDLSIVAISNLSAIAASLLMNMLVGPDTGFVEAIFLVALCCGVALLVGIICGLVNGILIDGIGISPILATLGSSLVFSGMAIVLTGGSAVIGLPAVFGWIGEGALAGIPVPVIVFFALAGLLHMLLTRFGFGADLFALGDNAVASRFAGINIRSVIVRTYVTSATVAVAAGLVIAARANSAKADYGSSYLLLSILVCVLGGVSPFGGRGTVVGVVLALFALQLLSSGLNLAGFNNFAVELVWGATLLATLALSQGLRARRT